MSSSLLTTSSEPRKRLIIRISHPQKRVNNNDDPIDDDHSQKRRRINEHEGKPILSCYWLDSSISLSEHKKNNNSLLIPPTKILSIKKTQRFLPKTQRLMLAAIT
ncbi:hypothetical protein QL285_036809 [Trifolium repens]|nr:hypothetical protein QL285_036809 [Trifolium repens]